MLKGSGLAQPAAPLSVAQPHGGASRMDELIGFAARLCLVAMFPLSAIDKVWHWRASIKQTEQAKLPGAAPMLIAAIAVEGLAPLCILAGWQDRPAAVILAGFCVVTAFLYHPFWRYADFFSPRDDSVAREHFWQFLKNFGLVGGLLLVVLAGSLSRLGEVVQPAAWSSHTGPPSAVAPPAR